MKSRRPGGFVMFLDCRSYSYSYCKWSAVSASLLYYSLLPLLYSVPVILKLVCSESFSVVSFPAPSSFLYMHWGHWGRQGDCGGQQLPYLTHIPRMLDIPPPPPPLPTIAVFVALSL